MLAPFRGRSALVSAFGALDVADGKILSSTLVDGTRITGAAWERKHMVIVPSLPGVPRRLYVNRAIVEPLTLALEAVAGSIYRVRTIGCFAPRGKRGNPSSLSLHSYGIAVDVNSDANPMRSPIVTDMPIGWVEKWEAIGWTWGGRWRTPDPMHFQFAAGV